MRDILGTLGAIFIGILLLSGIIQWVSDGFSTSRLSDVQSNLIMMQIKVQNLFSGSSSYVGLDNDLLMNNEIVPASLSKGGVISNPWGGEITFAPVDNGAAFSITLTDVPRKECTNLAVFQPDAWLGVTINATEIASGDVAGATNACSGDSNTDVYTTR